MDTPLFCISVPIWDKTEEQSDYTMNFVRGCLLLTEGNFILVIIDNASIYEQTKQFLQELSDPRVRIVYNTENLGYGNAANQGIQVGLEHGAEYFIVINNDVIISKSNWALAGFIRPLQENPRQLVGARYIDWNALVSFENVPEFIVPYCKHKHDGKWILPYLEGWCVAFHKSFVNEIGLFAENIFNWFEDVDLSIRTIEKGWTLSQSPEFSWRDWQGVGVGPLLHLYGQSGYVNLDRYQVNRITNQSKKYIADKWGMK